MGAKHGREYMRGNLRGWEIVRETVLFGERSKSFEADSAAHFCVGCSGAANDTSLIFGDPRLRSFRQAQGSAPQEAWRNQEFHLTAESEP